MEMHMRCGSLSALFHHRPFVLLAPPAAADLTFLPRGSRVLPSDAPTPHPTRCML
jgi:hypothetical protein